MIELRGTTEYADSRMRAEIDARVEREESEWEADLAQEIPVSEIVDAVLSYVPDLYEALAIRLLKHHLPQPEHLGLLSWVLLSHTFGDDERMAAFQVLKDSHRQHCANLTATLTFDPDACESANALYWLAELDLPSALMRAGAIIQDPNRTPYSKLVARDLLARTGAGRTAVSETGQPPDHRFTSCGSTTSRLVDRESSGEMFQEDSGDPRFTSASRQGSHASTLKLAQRGGACWFGRNREVVRLETDLRTISRQDRDYAIALCATVTSDDDSAIRRVGLQQLANLCLPLATTLAETMAEHPDECGNLARRLLIDVP